jgi:hypothetical protein
MTAGICLALSGCSAAPDPGTERIAGSATAALISDSAHGAGTPGFYFLPPIGAPSHRRGATAHGISPVVTIEELDGRGTIATFTRQPCSDDDRCGHGIGEHDGRFSVQWEFEDARVKDGLVYRIHVSVNGVELGFADAKGVRGREQRRAAIADGFVPLNDDEIEIAFRIEPAALGSARATVGADGGRVCAANGACLDIPPGSLGASISVAIEQTTLAPPAGALTPVYRLTPEGTVFDRSVRLSLPVPAGTTDASIYWTPLGSTASFEERLGLLSGDLVSAWGSHFSLVYGGAAVAPMSIDIQGTWADPALDVAMTMPDGSPGATAKNASSRDLVQNGAAFTFTSVNGVGMRSTCTGTIDGTSLASSCVGVNLGGTCTSHYTETATILPVSPMAMAVDATLVFTGANCAQAYRTYHVTGTITQRPRPLLDVSGTYSATASYINTGTGLAPQPGTWDATVVRTMTGSEVNSQVTSPQFTAVCRGPLVGNVLFEQCFSFSTSSIHFVGSQYGAFHAGTPASMSGAGGYALTAYPGGYDHMAFTYTATR